MRLVPGGRTHGWLLIFIYRHDLKTDSRLYGYVVSIIGLHYVLAEIILIFKKKYTKYL